MSFQTEGYLGECPRVYSPEDYLDDEAVGPRTARYSKMLKKGVKVAEFSCKLPYDDSQYKKFMSGSPYKAGTIVINNIRYV